ncbi:MAG: hypothetical protein BGO31_05970 [Bacteroidetes bacterium 43-16]|nr:MAG: hypothetical protein BGO31_05970 [Bacteroidetes bacterium 43-16]
MKKQWFLLLLLFTTISFGFVRCSKNDKSSDNARIELRLTDGPADYDAVLIDVQSVEINTEAGGWVSLPVIHPGVYDLLQLNNGLDTLLCEGALPVGNISQIRLILGNNNTIVVNGISHPLQTPSAQQSSLKINIHQSLQAGKVYKIWLDFDAGKSIVVQGNGGYLLKPVIRGFTDLTNGIIEGNIQPMITLPVVYVLQNNDTIASAIPHANGYFRFCGLPAGSYTLAIVPSVPNFTTLIIPNVTVTFGAANHLGILTIVP